MVDKVWIDDCFYKMEVIVVGVEWYFFVMELKVEIVCVSNVLEWDKCVIIIEIINVVEIIILNFF